MSIDVWMAANCSLWLWLSTARGIGTAATNAAVMARAIMDKTPKALLSRDGQWERPYCHPG